MIHLTSAKRWRLIRSRSSCSKALICSRSDSSAIFHKCAHLCSQTWLPLFYVPNLIVLPLLSLPSAADCARLAAIVLGGLACNLLLVGAFVQAARHKSAERAAAEMLGHEDDEGHIRPLPSTTPITSSEPNSPAIARQHSGSSPQVSGPNCTRQPASTNDIGACQIRTGA